MGHRWFYRVERNTKRHCWYTRAGGARRVAERAEKPVAVAVIERPEPVEKPADPVPQLQQSVANARAEADLSATSSIVSLKPVRETPSGHDHPDWKLSERWSDHASGGAPFEARPEPPRAPMSIAPPSAAEADDVSMQTLLDIAGGAFGFAAIVSLLVFTFARRRQQRDETRLNLFATTRRALHDSEPVEPVPVAWIRPPLGGSEQRGPPDEVAIRAFAPRNMRIHRA